MFSIPPLYPLLLSLAVLIVCIVTDLKCRQISPLVCLAFLLLSLFDSGRNYLASCGGAFLGFLPLFIAALFGSGGGGDALLAGVLGFILPFRFAAYLLLTASFSYMLVLALAAWKTGNRKIQLPYAPFLGFGWLLVLMTALFLDGGTAL